MARRSKPLPNPTVATLRLPRRPYSPRPREGSPMNLLGQRVRPGAMTTTRPRDDHELRKGREVDTPATSKLQSKTAKPLHHRFTHCFELPMGRRAIGAERCKIAPAEIQPGNRGDVQEVLAIQTRQGVQQPLTNDLGPRHFTRSPASTQRAGATAKQIRAGTSS